MRRLTLFFGLLIVIFSSCSDSDDQGTPRSERPGGDFPFNKSVYTVKSQGEYECSLFNVTCVEKATTRKVEYFSFSDENKMELLLDDGSSISGTMTTFKEECSMCFVWTNAEMPGIFKYQVYTTYNLARLEYYERPISGDIYRAATWEFDVKWTD